MNEGATPMTLPRLIADVGGTNARFALEVDGSIRAEQVLACAAYPTLTAAAQHYLRSADAAALGAPREACVAVACPVVGDHIAMTNHVWSFSASATRQALGLARLIFINDFTALALSLLHLPAAGLQQIGGGSRIGGQAIALIGPGTGLGVSGLVPFGQGWVPLGGEGGHVTLPATEEREFAVLRRLHQDHRHVSAERVLSGPGLELLYKTLCELDGMRYEALSAEAISAQALAVGSGLCRETLSMFCAWLGTVAGDLALTLGARGGVFIGGGIAPRIPEFLAKSPFRARFEAKGRFAAYLAPIATLLITAHNPALIGCARAFFDPSPRVEAG
jgi:glucokinase